MHVQLALATVAVFLALLVAEGWYVATVYRRTSRVRDHRTRKYAGVRARQVEPAVLSLREADRGLDAPARARALGFHDLERDDDTFAEYAEFGGEVRR